MTPFSAADLTTAAPELFLAVAGLVLLLAGVFRGDRSTAWVTWAVVGAMALAAALVSQGGTARVLAFDGLYVSDAFSLFMKQLTLLGSALALLLSLGFNEREGIARFEYPILFLFATLGMLMMISANDMLSLYVSLELQSLCLYVVAAYRRDSVRSTEAGLKYFVLGALSSGMLLYGISLVYGYTGTTRFEMLLVQFGDMHGAPPLGVVIGLVFVLAGLCFKVSAVPFHMWTPDVYEGAPTPVTAFFAAAPKVAALALFARVTMGGFGPLVEQWSQIVVAVSIASMALGAFAAINQTNIKRLMAYSSIGHMGYVLIGLAAGSEAGIRGMLIYVAIYVVMGIGTFACILCMRRQGRMVEGIADLAGLARTQPAVALALAVFMFSMSGIPPLAGFFGKFYVFMAAIEAGMYVLAVLGVLSSVVAAYYYLRIVKIMYFDEPAEAFDRPVGAVLGTVLAGTSLFTLFFFLAPGMLLSSAKAAAAALAGG
ncbi:MAG: NADH-quinone oxidoreductase subunit NuoN [Alphaproteobacteria bacterium]|nr:NADH-quinone oxidoreductase subunit NuoN [Alphaproteobacteria bacterium]